MDGHMGLPMSGEGETTSTDLQRLAPGPKLRVPPASIRKTAPSLCRLAAAATKTLDADSD